MEYKVSNEEIESMKLIMQKRDIAMFNANPANLNMSATDEQKQIWIRTVLDYQAEINYLFQNWWDEQTKKYQLDGEYKLDFQTGELKKNTVIEGIKAV